MDRQLQKNYECPVCKSHSNYIFTSKHSHSIFECSNKLCGHFCTPTIRNAQGICVRGKDIQKESDESLKIYDERNVRLLRLFRRYMRSLSRPTVFLDFGAGNAHISRTYKRLMQDQCIIYCLEPNPICEGLYQKYGLIQVESLEEIREKIDFVYMIEVIEHLDNPISALKSLRKTLATDGSSFYQPQRAPDTRP